ncbi:hypothetical protein SUNI508_00793 [Seiridium unicorne]|uniref:DUF6536 domain-containing protein n=1 Tax=Seiridium unicorne TaxID=138068 RepID=A0ABR2V1I2_9PEZI
MDRLRPSHSLGNHHRYSGWRRAAHVNSVILIVLTALLLSCLIASITETGSVTVSLFFFEGGCDGGSATQTNVALHLLLNIVSTAVFASSNFFMQVLNSPSREEVDRAHATGSYLGIGVPSMRNAFRVGRFKTVGWIFLLLSSIPMHLLFNSMIFQTDQRTGDFYLTIASETFLEGDKYYAPGASLAPGGLLFGDDLPDDFHEHHGTLGYGAQQNKTEYVSNTSDTWRNISAAAADGGGWEKLSINDCLNSYVFCDGLKEYVDVILVVNQTDSWVRNSVWNTTGFSTDFWDPLVPAEQPNSLWFSAQCHMIAKFDDKQGTVCGSDCFSALEAKSIWDIDISDMTPEDNVWPIHFFSDVMEYVNRSHSDSWSSESNHFFSLNPGFADLSVDYCLAQPSERVCHVGLSNVLLLAITVCVFLKTVTAVVITVVLGRRNQPPLVTLGDAIESFIQRPDQCTLKFCTIGQREVRRARDYPSERLVPEPRLWRSDIHRRWGAVPSSVWASTYLLFFISIGIVAIFLPISMRYRGISGTFTESDTNSFVTVIQFTFIGGVLAANSPQLLLSFCYLAYNNLFTRLQMAKEWSEFSLGYRPLRVTDPKWVHLNFTCRFWKMLINRRGEQYATYRLQLPYKYSIPLIACSIFLHWLLSNTVYLFVSEGGYYASTNTEYSDPSLPSNTATLMGFSVKALLVMLIVSLVLVLIPIVLSFMRLPSGTVLVGSNSFAISAACHVSSVSGAADVSCPDISGNPAPSGRGTLSSKYSPLEDISYDNEQATEQTAQFRLADPKNRSNSIEMQRLINNQTSSQSLRTQHSNNQLTQEELFVHVSRSKLRWGVVKMPAGFYAQFQGLGQYEHLSFGVEEDAVEPPVPGKYYV